MAEGKKLDLEELKRSFPSLDDLSASKLLGGIHSGSFGGWWEVIGDIDFGMLDPLVITGQGSGSGYRGPGGYGAPGGFSGSGGSGSDYFGDSDMVDDLGDMVWGDGPIGWGGSDYEPGGGSPGGENDNQRPGPPWQGPQPYRRNSWDSLWRPYDIKNFSDKPVMVQYGPFGTQPHIVQPGHTFSAPDGWDWEIDGVNINGYTFKLTDGFGFVDVFNNYWTTNYSFPGADLLYRIRGGLLREPPTDDGNWNQIFYWSP